MGLSIAAFLEENKDIVALGGDEVEDYLCNLRCMIGVPITDERMRLVAAANNGVDNSFVADSENSLPGTVAKRMVDVAKTTCYIERNDDGIWIGDCEDCHERLGRNCPEALWVRSKHNQLDKPLEVLRKVPADKNGDPAQSTGRGNYTGCHRS